MFTHFPTTRAHALFAVFLLSTIAISGCLDNDDEATTDPCVADPTLAQCQTDGGEEEGVGVEACEHWTEGPFVSVQAVSSATDTTIDAVGDDHKSYAVAFTTITGGNGGFVEFPADEAGDFIFFLDADVPFSILESDGVTEVEIEESLDSDPDCADVMGRHTVELGVGTAIIMFGPTPEDGANVVIEHAGEGHHHEEGE